MPNTAEILLTKFLKAIKGRDEDTSSQMISTICMETSFSTNPIILVILCISNLWLGCPADQNSSEYSL